MIYKVESCISHLETIRVLLAFYIAYDQAFRAKQAGDEKLLIERLDECASDFTRARELARETASMVAEKTDDPTAGYIPFRYNVRFILPLEEFSKFVNNVVNFHHGRPYWESVDWGAISPPSMVS